jgi:hypothetical protein
MQHLTESEKAYRRGALQTLQFIIPNLSYGMTGTQVINLLVKFQEALIKGRVSLDPKYLGTYMDTITKEVMGECCTLTECTSLYTMPKQLPSSPDGDPWHPEM